MSTQEDAMQRIRDLSNELIEARRVAAQSVADLKIADEENLTLKQDVVALVKVLHTQGTLLESIEKNNRKLSNSLKRAKIANVNIEPIAEKAKVHALEESHYHHELEDLKVLDEITDSQPKLKYTQPKPEVSGIPCLEMDQYKRLINQSKVENV